MGDRDVLELRRRIEILERVCGEAYQFAGEAGAPARVLDNLWAASQGRLLPHDSFLPITRYECDPIRRSAKAIDRK